MRITSPPVKWPCFYGIDTDSQEQLIASHNSVEEIRGHIGADSLAYLSLPAMVEATGACGHSFCLACFDGEYPIEIPKAVKAGKLALESGESMSADAAGEDARRIRSPPHAETPSPPSSHRVAGGYSSQLVAGGRKGGAEPVSGLGHRTFRSAIRGRCDCRYG
jgi:hypothetical protein